MITAQDKAELEGLEFIEEQRFDAPAGPIHEALRQIEYLLHLRRVQDEVNEGKQDLISALQKANRRLRERNSELERTLANLLKHLATSGGLSASNEAVQSASKAIHPPPANSPPQPSEPRLTAEQHNAYPLGRWSGGPRR